MSNDSWKWQYKEIKDFLENKYDVKVNLRYEYKYDFTINIFMKKDISTSIIKSIKEHYPTWHPDFWEITLDPHLHYKHGAKKIIAV
ncbi:MAG: hypothetical protein ACPLX8_00910, partial [Nanopusillaceae archaeon]